MKKVLSWLAVIAAVVACGLWGAATITHNSSASAATTRRWNKSKDRQLNSFINSWAPKMNQSYKKYDGQNSLHVSTGGNYPDDLSKEVTPDGGSIGWAPTGKGHYDYNVVAIYNYDGTRPPLPNRITYFFAFHHGKPVALVDQTRDGDPTCKPTANQDVAKNFRRIANEK